ncbi:MAG: UDP-4-amino-4,6-dideoxy-N-acetyl-beta-L-altrosamine transaminase [Thermodesulfobacteriota bacterium]
MTEKDTMSERYDMPYGRQNIDEDDIRAVTDVLRSGWLTTGPKVEEFERKGSGLAGTRHAVAVNSGTAALHAAVHAVGIKPGDEVILSPMTFAATGNVIVHSGGVPVFADVDPDTLNIDPECVENKITPKTRAVIAVDYAGQMCDYRRLKEIARKRNLSLIADACHSFGGSMDGAPSGSCADISVFSFHPVKNITTGEGGMAVTDNAGFAERIKRFRNHGISMDASRRELADSWYYEIEEPGYNYRITDIQCALGISQLEKISGWIDERNRLAELYDGCLEGVDKVKPLARTPGVKHAYHLYVVRLTMEDCREIRPEIFRKMRRAGIGVNVHYIPVHYHPFYRKTFHTREGMCPAAEDAYERILTLPMFPGMQEKDVQRVCAALKEFVGK